MKYGFAIGALLVLSAAPARAQETVTFTRAVEPQSMTPARVATTVVETRITTGRPYAAEATTEFVQTLGDGNKIARKATVRIYRDGEGRTRREELADRRHRQVGEHLRSGRAHHLCARPGDAHRAQVGGPRRRPGDAVGH